MQYLLLLNCAVIDVIQKCIVITSSKKWLVLTFNLKLQSNLTLSVAITLKKKRLKKEELTLQTRSSVSDEESPDRALMRKWLVEQVNNRSIHGLCWLDEGKSKFRVPWVHGSRHGWNNADAELFRKWAEHTGNNFFI